MIMQVDIQTSANIAIASTRSAISHVKLKYLNALILGFNNCLMKLALPKAKIVN